MVTYWDGFQDGGGGLLSIVWGVDPRNPEMV